MNNRYLQALILIALAVAALFLLSKKSEAPTVAVTDFGSCQIAGGEINHGDPVTCKMPDGSTFEEEEHPEPEVVLDTPQYGALVKSPLVVTGKAKGTWFFEANLPVTLKDVENNKVLVQVGAQAQSDWMTTEYVPFTATLNFDPGTAQYGVLVIEKDNPSGMPEFDSSFAIPVKFRE